MYLLDTNHCSAIIKGETGLIEKLGAMAANRIRISATIHGELLYMAFKSQQCERNLRFVDAFVSDIVVYRIDSKTALVYGRLKAELLKMYGPKAKEARSRTKLQSLGFSDNDLWIAATAIRHNLTLVTADADFTRIRQAMDFPVESWI